MAQVIIEKIDKLKKVKPPIHEISEVKMHFQRRKISFYKRLEKKRAERAAVGKTNL